VRTRKDVESKEKEGKKMLKKKSAILLYIPDVLGSNIGLETGYFD
jgi:hypothetical protein